MTVFFNQTETLPPSINIARYPSAEEFGVWRNVVLEEEYKMVFRFIGSIRKVRASYNLPNRTKTQLILCCADNEVCYFMRNRLIYLYSQLVFAVQCYE